MKTNKISPHGQEIQRALQEAVADAIEEHRRAGKPIVVARNGQPVHVNPNSVRTVREEHTEYGTPDPQGSPRK